MALKLLLVLLLVTVQSASAAAPLCLRCHPSHHTDRGTCTSCHRGNDRALRTSLAHFDLIPGRLAAFALPADPVRELGKRLADQLACRRCHILERRGNRLAGDLDRTATLPISQLRSALQSPAWYMPDFRLHERDRDALLAYLLFAGQANATARKPEVPLVVHFADERRDRLDPFNRHCGGCHRTLTRRYGGLGAGNAAPNLAGLLTPHYPLTWRGALPWTPAVLQHWLANPRASRPQAVMPPVRLTSLEFANLLQQLRDPGK